MELLRGQLVCISYILFVLTRPHAHENLVRSAAFASTGGVDDRHLPAERALALGD